MAVEIRNLTITGRVRDGDTNKANRRDKDYVSREQFEQVKRELLRECQRLVKQSARSSRDR